VTAHSPENLFNLHFDLPLGLAIQLWRRGVFGNISAEDFYDGNNVSIRIDPDRRDEPLFLKINKKGEGIVDVKDVKDYADVALSAAGANRQIRRVCESVGIGRSTPNAPLRVYMFRRGAATELYQSIGQVNARSGLRFHIPYP
jgi:hypothetical protein